MKKILVLTFISLLYCLPSVASQKCAKFKLGNDEIKTSIPVKNQFIEIITKEVQVNNFYCMKQKDNSFVCDGDDDSGKLVFKENKVIVHSIHIGNPDKKMYHYTSKSKKENSFELTKCNKSKK